MARRHPSLLLSLLIASSASAVTMDWTPIGNPGNACELQPAREGIPGGCFGAVDYDYSIGTYEVTNAQYAEFLNAKAQSGSTLYSTNMGSGYGGITRSGSAGSFTYSTIAGRENIPVNWVSFENALRFANWMNNGQGSGSTAIGSYTITGATHSITRNPGAIIVVPSEDEWYKAAYYNPITTSYFDFPAGSDTQTACSSAPTATPNRANCGTPAGADLKPRGSYTGSASPYGTFDQGGNVYELNEAIVLDFYRGVRGGSLGYNPEFMSAAHRTFGLGGGETGGFRIAYIPEPTTGLLMIAGLFGLAGWRRQRN